MLVNKTLGQLVFRVEHTNTDDTQTLVREDCKTLWLTVISKTRALKDSLVRSPMKLPPIKKWYVNPLRSQCILRFNSVTHSSRDHGAAHYREAS